MRAFILYKMVRATDHFYPCQERYMILVDDRERRSGICEALASLQVPHQVGHLEIGDYIVNDALYIERKTVADFLESV